MLAAGAGLLGIAWFGNHVASMAACWDASWRVSGRVLSLNNLLSECFRGRVQITGHSLLVLAYQKYGCCSPPLQLDKEAGVRAKE